VRVLTACADRAAKRAAKTPKKEQPWMRRLRVAISEAEEQLEEEAELEEDTMESWLRRLRGSAPKSDSEMMY
jgi:hypothetical protein